MNDSSLSGSAVATQLCYYVSFPSEGSKKVYGAAQVSRDVVPMILMNLTSSIILLYKHKQQVKGAQQPQFGQWRRVAQPNSELL